jgi:hypothetical protein
VSAAEAHRQAHCLYCSEETSLLGHVIAAVETGSIVGSRCCYSEHLSYYCIVAFAPMTSAPVT